MNNTSGVTGTAVITMKAWRASMEVLSPKPVPIHNNTKVRLPIIKAQNNLNLCDGSLRPLTTMAAA